MKYQNVSKYFSYFLIKIELKKLQKRIHTTVCIKKQLISSF